MNTLTTNIETLAHHMDKKPNKEIVQDYIKELYTACECSETRQKLGEMYKYFTPTRPKVVKDDVAWVFKSVSKDVTKPYLHLSHSDGKFLTATDGKTLHQIPTDLPEGYYNDKGVKIDFDGTFPDVKKVIPECGTELKINIKDVPIVHMIHRDEKFTAYKIQKGEEVVYLNIKLLERALNGNKEFTLYFSSRGDGKAPRRIQIVDGNRLALIMGMNGQEV